MRILTLELDHLPPRALSPNVRVHWGAKYEAMRLEREDVYLRANSIWHRQTPMAKARLSIEFHVRNKRIRDYDNLLAACKPIPDGLVAAGVIANDSIHGMEIGGIRAVFGETEKTVVTVEEIG